jgi:very-short-patch-repair endonuclease
MEGRAGDEWQEHGRENDMKPNYSPKYVTEIAKGLRKRETFPEKVLWDALRNKQFHGLKFLRQHPVGRFVVDFYCHELRLVVEVEGDIHEKPGQQEYDKERFAELEACGKKILRVKNEDVVFKLEGVLERIIAFKTTPSHPSSPTGEKDVEGLQRAY